MHTDYPAPSESVPSNDVDSPRSIARRCAAWASSSVTFNYPEFGDFCDIAAEILGITPEQVAGLPNVGLAERVAAGQVTREEVLAWLSERTASV